MTLPDLKQLEAIIKLCRKNGVHIIKIDNIELTLKDVPRGTRRSKGDQEPKTSQNTEDEMLFWSSPMIGADNA